MTIESACELLYSMSKALRKNGTILRITGTQGMGYILCLAAIMFPEDVSVTVDGLVVREGLRECVLIEIVETSSGVTEIHLEQIINSGWHETSLPIVAFRTFSLRSDLSTQGCFDWSGWIAAYLELNFLEFGLKCPRSVLTACCNLLYNLFFELDRLSNSHIPGCRLGQFLGPYPARRIRRVCERIWGVSLQDAGATDVDSTVKHSMDVLAEAISGATSGLECPQCPLQNHDDPEVIWQHFDKKTIRNKIHAGELVCNKCCLWIFIRACLGYGWNCLFVNPETSSTITPNGKGAIIGNLISITRDAQSQQILSGQGDLVPKSLTYREIYQSVVDMFAVPGRIADFNRTHRQIAWGCGSSTLYAVAAEKLDHPWNLNFQFDLVEGQITDVGEHYVSIGSAKSIKKRRKARDSMTTNSSEITPSCLGAHSRISVSVVGWGSELQVHTMAYVSGKSIEFDLATLIIGSWEVEQAKPCIHDPKTTPLKDVYANDVVTTSVAKPLAKDKMKVAIAQTQSNRVAQFLCGQPRVRALWQKDCCLNCAFEQAKPAGKEAPDYRLIICG
ncbi:hypothetical protein B0J14DRAFT_109140 [Halenospora varia]|nr:hypothetical protein B0J14DRAFT_109140 [Halenospora varia]